MSRKIKVLHLEPTDVCQAACPLCARETDKNFNKSLNHHLTIDQILKHFNDGVIADLDKVFMCGNYGDPAAGQHTKTIYQYFRNINPRIVLGMNTNGALKNSKWWHEIGKIFNQQNDYVVFSIDGLEDTNHIYRRNVDWGKLLNNAQAYILAGGPAHWDMLVYKHNQHQVDACEQMARDMGFKWFRAKVSKRGFTDGLEAPFSWQMPKVVDTTTTINCHVLAEQSAYIDAQGRMSPCCWLGARQLNFVTDFDAVQRTWNSAQPNLVCLDTCGSTNNGTRFSDQWQRETQLC